MELSTVSTSTDSSTLTLRPRRPTLNALPGLHDSNKDPDYVLVYSETTTTEKDDEEPLLQDQKIKRQRYEVELKLSGLKIKEEKHDDKIFVKITASEKALRKYCEILKIRIPVKYDIVEAENPRSHKCGCKLFCCCDSILETAFPKVDYKWTAEYFDTKEHSIAHDIFEYDEKNSFSTSVRCMIVNFILERTIFSDVEEDVGLNKLLSENIYEAGFPLHEGTENDPTTTKGKLTQEWASYSRALKRQPIDHIKDYFGVKVALYFAWLGFYTYMLLPPAIFGVICVVYGWYSRQNDLISDEICNSNIIMCPSCDAICEYEYLNGTCTYSRVTYIFDNYLTIYFALFMSLWSVLYLEWWKRYSAEITHRWGLTGYDLSGEHPRTQFLQTCIKQKIKERKVNVVTKQVEPKVPYWCNKIPRMFVSYVVVLFMMALALAVMLGLVIYSISASTSYQIFGAKDIGVQSDHYKSLIVPFTSAVINLLGIFVLNILFDKIATKVTEFEFHRTQTEYDNSLMLKMYMFQFVNYYSSLFYIAFVKGKFTGYPKKYHRIFGWRQEECGVEGCLMELCIQLAIIMIGEQIKDSIIEILSPWWIITCKNLEKYKDKPFYSRWWISVKIQKYDYKAKTDYELLSWSTTEFASEYLEMVLQYGFVTIFVCVFPLAPLFALINNIFEIRIDARKYLLYYQRPVAQRVRHIGVWLSVMDIIGKLSVASNAFIIAFSSNFIPKILYYKHIQNNITNGLNTSSFLDFTLAYFDTKDFEEGMEPNMKSNESICRYEAFRYPPWDEQQKYERLPLYWEMFTYRLAFVVGYTYLAYIIVTVIQIIIPDVPKKLQDKIRREAYELRDILIEKGSVQSPVIL